MLVKRDVRPETKEGKSLIESKFIFSGRKDTLIVVKIKTFPVYWILQNILSQTLPVREFESWHWLQITEQ